MFNASVRRVIYILELTGTFTCTWPIDPNSTKREIVYRTIRWSFAMFNVIFLMVSLVLAVFHFRNDVIILMKTASEMTALLEVFFDLLICKMKNAQLQVLIEKIKAYLEVIDEQEIKIIQGYVDRYQKFFSVTAMTYVATAISFSFVPLFSAQELPADGWIPFSMEPSTVYWLIYASQVYCILQTAFCIGVDFTIAVLFTYAAAKLDALGMKLRQVNSRDMLVSCVKEHQEIIGFVEATKATVEALLFKTNATMGSAVICGAFPLIYNQSLAIVSQFLPLVVSGCAHLFVISWPADDLKESSLRFAKSLNEIPWLGMSRDMVRIVVIMMQRSQKAFLIKMGGLLPALTLEYYANFLTTVSSYFMAMRTMIES
ncbi:odorant receptor 49b-like [Xylocopa sonorina]|uniref:odorant receptor 49b-like n=1 Tax=Xylocopa sonorina TaxID=1818115 RepID=UPI00403A8BD0